MLDMPCKLDTIISPAKPDQAEVVRMLDAEHACPPSLPPADQEAMPNTLQATGRLRANGMQQSQSLSEKRLVVSIEVDGRKLQTVTEWWPEKPTGLQAFPDSAGGWLTSQIYDPATRSYYPPSLLTSQQVN